MDQINPENESLTPDQSNPPIDSVPVSQTPDVNSLAGAHVKAYEGFDPSVHAVNEDGTPKRRGDGSYALKRGRKPGQTSSSGKLPPKKAQGAVVENAPEVSQVTPEDAAKQSANMVILANVMLLGEDIGRPDDKAEAESLKVAFENYYTVKGVPNFPPEIGLIIAVGAYTGKRLIREESKPRLQVLKEKVFAVISRFRKS